MTALTEFKAPSALSRTKPSQEIALLKEPVLFAIKVDKDRIPAAILNAVNVFWFDDIEDDAAVLVDFDGNRFNLREAPLCALAILVDPKKADKERGHLLDWLRARGSASRPPVIEWSIGHELDAAARIIDEVSRSLTSTALRIVQANRELLALRTLNDDLQNRFAAIETFLHRHGLQPFDLTFSNEPVSNPSQPNVLADASVEGISQILPVASSGISAIAIHFERLARHGDAELHAQLVGLEDLRIIDTWAVPLSQCGTGWNFLGLTRTLSGLRRTVELRLRVTGSEDELPLLSLGGLQPLDMFQVRDAANKLPLLKNSLAMQVWCGLPGATLPAWANYVPAQSRQNAAGGFKELPIAPGVLELVSHANSDEVSFDFPAILALPKERAIACHPPTNGMTIGKLPAACPPEVLRISSTAWIDNEQSKDVDFAMAVAGNVESARELFEEKRAAGVGETFSGWVRVTYGDMARVSSFVAEQVGTWQNIYVATRMTNPGVNSFAWAKFRDISIMVNG
jgi:hypothetical protein